jgi:hypothetical protein
MYSERGDPFNVCVYWLLHFVAVPAAFRLYVCAAVIET